ncbi:NAD(P)/FAD-dependent oxidoreductase [Candidatus Saccharibacteria bacterium]|nr:NAD(P)/FAD-dependent oxidoreductase [Candidatus Saccharibacteria bacterium]
MARAKNDFDLIVIGSGAAGGASALMAAGAGKKVALIEAHKWGGSSLNYTGVPMDALFHATHLLTEAAEGVKFGISSSNLRYNYPTINNWKNVAMRRAGAGSKKAFEDAGITCVKGRAHFLGSYQVGVNDVRLTARKILIATGAQPLDTGIKGLHDVNFMTPDSILDLIRPPRTIFVVGAGSTGCEVAQYFAELGTKVLVAEVAGRLLPKEDEEVGQVMDNCFNKLGIKVLTQSRVVALEKDSVSKKVIFMRGGQEKSVRIDEVILCTGSTPATDLGLENAGIKYGAKGIKVNKNLQTSMKHIFAAGDCIGGDSSTEKAVLEAAVAVSNLVHRPKAVVEYAGLSRITRTYPEVASVGATEDDCIRRDRKIRKVVVPLSTVEASNTSDFRDGFVKIITDRNRKIIGASIVAPRAGILIQEIAMAIRLGLYASDIADTPHIASDWGELIRIAARRLS